jgi:hypothetical protein
MPFGFRPVGHEFASTYWIRNDSINESHYAYELPSIIDFLKRGIAYYRQLDAVHGDLNKMKLKAPRTSKDQFALPGQVEYQYVTGLDQPIMMPFGRRESTNNLSQAKDNWLQNGPMFLEQSERQLAALTRRIAELRKAQLTPPALDASIILRGLAVGLGLSAIFLGVNAGVLSLARVARRRRIRRPVVA